MKLLIAHDGSPRSDAAVGDLAACGLPPRGEALVLSVADAWTALEGDAAPSAGSAGGAILRAALAKAGEAASRGRDAVGLALPGWNVRSETIAGSPGWEIVKRADEWSPDLLVLGATGTSAWERFLFGTTTTQVASHARCSVRISRPNAGRAAGPPRLLLPCDGSSISLDAMRVIARRTWPAGSRARIVTAVDGWLVAALESEEATGEKGARDRAATLPDLAAGLLGDAGLRVETATIDGDPKRVLVEEAERWGADAILLGARGRSGLSRLLLGSVALSTAARAACSVEIVRSSSHEARLPEI
jgi:nucleotide-binding universal stress UspA family protein